MGSRQYPDWLGFEERTVATAESGQPLESWSIRFPRYGQVLLQSSTESTVNDQLVTAEQYTVKLPFDAAAARVTAMDWRLRWRDQLGNVRVLNLVGTDATARGRQSELVFSATLDR